VFPDVQLFLTILCTSAMLLDFFSGLFYETTKGVHCLSPYISGPLLLYLLSLSSLFLWARRNAFKASKVPPMLPGRLPGSYATHYD
jgi:hypothetical protein